MRTELPGNTIEERIKMTTINIGEKIACVRYHEVLKNHLKPLSLMDLTADEFEFFQAFCITFQFVYFQSL